MNRHGFILMALAIIAIASWAYNVNYNTLTTLDRVSDLRKDIADEREAIQVLRVEWAYLNGPDRLARLARLHEKQLGLQPLTPEALQYVAAVPFLKPADVESVAIPVRTGPPIPAARPVGWMPP